MLLNMQNFRLRFRNAPKDVWAVDGVNLQMEEGTVLALVGESGSGKTATAMSICGLMEPERVITQGSIVLDGQELLGCRRRTLRDRMGSTVGVVFQEPMNSLNPLQPVGRQVELALRLHSSCSKQQYRAEALAAMRQAGLAEPESLYTRYPHELSGGQLQRICIAAAIITKPKLLVADEPTTALDVTTQDGILELLKQLNRESHMAILFISHNLQVVRRLCQQALVMKDGKIVERGNVESIFANPQHPYTQELIAAIPTRQKRQVRP